MFDVVAYGKRHVVMGATQVDRHGNQNISCIGDFAQPKRQLLGVRGAPGNTVNNKTSYWVPKHSERVFVEQVDVVSGVGRTRAEQAGPAATRFHGVHRVVSNLAVLDFAGPEHTMRLVSTHPGVTVDEVRAASGCEIHADDDVPETRAPTMSELVLIREVLDPRSLRDREVSGMTPRSCSAPRSPSWSACGTPSYRPAWGGSRVRGWSPRRRTPAVSASSPARPCRTTSWRTPSPRSRAAPRSRSA